MIEECGHDDHVAEISMEVAKSEATRSFFSP